MKKTPKKFKKTPPPSSVFSTAEEGATGYQDSLDDDDRTSLFGEEDEFTTGTEIAPTSPLQASLQKFSEKLEKAKQRALKKLEPAPGWKPFGTPTKRRLHGKDW